MAEKDIIEIVRELGRQLQKEPVYISYMAARQAADADEELQNLIADFTAIREHLADFMSKPEEERSKDEADKINDEMRKTYAKIMTNEHMINYNDTKDEFDVLMRRINTIIEQCSQGEDPDTTDYTPSCSGSCASCGGCG